MADYETHEHDVLVIGAGGAGLRAAIEASAAGVRVGLVCKSLLGKAHTVMAEGGIAASKLGEPCSTAPKMVAFCSVILAATNTRDSRTSGTAPVWR